MLPIMALVLTQATQPKAEQKPLVPFPHPLITEILYAVPTKGGDADQDGQRSATGDEFIELINPHDRPINLKGYVLSDSSSQAEDDPKTTDDATKPADATPTQPSEPPKAPAKKDAEHSAKPKSDGTAAHKKDGKTTTKAAPKDSRIHFVFPDLTLQPGEIVVVFNGFESHPVGPVGTTSTAAKKNDKFNNAYVLCMNIKNKYMALSNSGDYVLITDPKGVAVECVHWGNRKPEKGLDPILDETAPECKVSVQRKNLQSGFVEHTAISPDAKFSPGKFESKKDE